MDKKSIGNLFPYLDKNKLLFIYPRIPVQHYVNELIYQLSKKEHVQYTDRAENKHDFISVIKEIFSEKNNNTISQFIENKKHLSHMYFAMLCRDAYHPTNDYKNIEGVKRWELEHLAEFGLQPYQYHDDKSGLQAVLYQFNRVLIVAFAGTNQWVDLYESLKQGLGRISYQYQSAVELALFIRERYSGDLLFTGHSLGGGLASLCALKTNSMAVTFNAAGISDNTLITNGLDIISSYQLAQSLICHYSVQYDWLTYMQSIFLLPKAIGQSIEIPYVPYIPSNVRRKFSEWIAIGLEAHNINKTIESLYCFLTNNLIEVQKNRL